MNLKESFRYQNFLDRLLSSAYSSITSLSHCYKVTKNHLRSKSNPDERDEVEDVVLDEFFKNDDVINFITVLINEKEKLALAITDAKNKAGFDIDAAIAVNKSRQSAINYIKTMLMHKSSKTKERGTGYKFNVEGNQQPYYYEIEVSKTENFDRAAAKETLKKLSDDSDKASTKIDEVLINTVIDYEPIYDINDTFDDIMTEFTSKE